MVTDISVENLGALFVSMGMGTYVPHTLVFTPGEISGVAAPNHMKQNRAEGDLRFDDCTPTVVHSVHG